MASDTVSVCIASLLSKLFTVAEFPTSTPKMQWEGCGGIATMALATCLALQAFSQSVATNTTTLSNSVRSATCTSLQT